MVDVIDWKDNEDGSVDLTIQMTEEEQDMFVKIGILTAIKEGVKKLEENKDE